ncbi:MAG: DM13 domain-containing protein [Ferruginibacter sp.]
MRQLLIVLTCFSSSFISCKKNATPATVLNEMTDTTAVLKYSGDFISARYGTVTGKAEIYKKASTFEVKLANFNTSNGPALHVFISKESMPLNFIDLGPLKSTSGNQVYPVAGMPDFTNYKYISIHCVDYNHLFGWALLQ